MVAGSGLVAISAGRWSLVQDWLLLVVAGARKWSLVQDWLLLVVAGAGR